MPAPFINPMLGNNINNLNQQAQIQKLLMDQMRPGMKRPMPMDSPFMNKRPMNLDNAGLLNPLLLQSGFQLSNPVQKQDEHGRMPHRLIEKKRRDRINSCINTLRDLLPDQIKKATNRPLEKAIVLELAIDYIKDLTKNQVKKEEVEIKKEAEIISEETNKSLRAQLAASYEKGWKDCSSAIKSNSEADIQMPLLKKEKIDQVADEIFKNFEVSSSVQKRMPSGSSEGYLSDDRQRNTSSSNECSSEDDNKSPILRKNVQIKQEAVDNLVQLHQSTESDEDFEINVDF